jgi:hypothetical protein
MIQIEFSDADSTGNLIAIGSVERTDPLYTQLRNQNAQLHFDRRLVGCTSWLEAFNRLQAEFRVPQFTTDTPGALHLFTVSTGKALGWTAAELKVASVVPVTAT